MTLSISGSNTACRRVPSGGQRRGHRPARAIVARLLLWAALVALPLSIARAQTQCELGEEGWVVACANLATRATWSDAGREECVFTPAPGWVITDYNATFVNTYHGRYALELVEGGTPVASDSEIAAAFDNLQRTVAESSKPESRDKFQARIEALGKSMTRNVKRHATARNTLRAVVEASGTRDNTGRGFGWASIRVNAQVKCLGDPDPTILAQQMARAIKFTLGRRYRLVNSCSYTVDLALAYERLDGKWETAYWWTLEPNARADLSEGEDAIRSQSRVVYYYARVYESDYEWDVSGTRNTRAYMVDNERYEFKRAKLRKGDDGFYEFAFRCPDLE